MQTHKTRIYLYHKVFSLFSAVGALNTLTFVCFSVRRFPYPFALQPLSSCELSSLSFFVLSLPHNTQAKLRLIVSSRAFVAHQPVGCWWILFYLPNKRDEKKPTPHHKVAPMGIATIKIYTPHISSLSSSSRCRQRRQSGGKRRWVN